MAEWSKAPAYESGGCRFDSCRRHPHSSQHLAVAQWTRAPLSEGGGARSTRAGEAKQKRSCRDRPVVRMPGPQPGDRGSTPRRGAAVPTVPDRSTEGRPVVARPMGVRVLLWQPRGRRSTASGSQRAMLRMRVRLPPTTPSQDSELRGRGVPGSTSAPHVEGEGSTPSAHTKATSCR